ncbi:MAG: DUF2147 domain-containing protein [Proteobacteria bacterium]|nr:DUF2147 domain-containing protein [Pseudomonadota bacterium]
MMKKISAVLMVFCFTFMGVSAVYAVDPDAVVGTWLIDKKKDASQVTISKCGSKYCGAISWLKDAEEIDDKNPDESKKGQKLLGLNMIWGFEFDDDEWGDGYVYNPQDGKTYDCKMWMDSNDVLQVKGTVGPRWMGIGKTTTWYRVK